MMGFTPFQQFLPLAGGTVAGSLAVTGSVTAGSSPGAPIEELVASTGPAGFALQNATPTILTWNVPNDGNLHRFTFYGTRNVTVAETGGSVALNYTPEGGGAQSLIVAAGGAGVGNGALANSGVGFTVAPGTTVTLTQTAALTAGACQVYAELWGS